MKYDLSHAEALMLLMEAKLTDFDTLERQAECIREVVYFALKDHKRVYSVVRRPENTATYRWRTSISSWSRVTSAPTRVKAAPNRNTTGEQK